MPTRKIEDKELLNCVAFILTKQKAFLAEKRAENKILGAGFITIPGGHINKNETMEQALIREITEELCIIPKKYEFLCKKISEHQTGKRLVHYFIVKEWKGQPEPKEAEELFWIKLAENKKLNLEIDREAIQEYLEQKPIT